MCQQTYESGAPCCFYSATIFDLCSEQSFTLSWYFLCQFVMCELHFGRVWMMLFPTSAVIWVGFVCGLLDYRLVTSTGQLPVSWWEEQQTWCSCPTITASSQMIALCLWIAKILCIINQELILNFLALQSKFTCWCHVDAWVLLHSLLIKIYAVLFPTTVNWLVTATMALDWFVNSVRVFLFAIIFRISLEPISE